MFRKVHSKDRLEAVDALAPVIGARRGVPLPLLVIVLLLVGLAIILGRDQLMGNAAIMVAMASTTLARLQDKASSAPASSNVEPRLIISLLLPDGSNFDILDEPVPADCYAQNNADYDGDAVRWGLGNKAHSAAGCCAQCKAHRGKPRCNVWVWCGDPSGVCWTMDIHNHTTGDCWLKYQAGWDNIVDLKKSNLKVNHQNQFTPAFRKEHKTAPLLVPWVAGLVPQARPAP
ncbi:hypothetical protein V8C86DRAFT_2508271 [Haematococcus lacustris]